MDLGDQSYVIICLRGRWRFVMHAPDKGNFNNEVEFIAIEAPYSIYWMRHSKPLFRIAVIFTATTEETTDLVFRMIFETPEESEKLRKFVVGKNEENFDRLESELKKMEILRA